MANMGGYNFEIFESKTDEKFQCNHCQLILREPVQSACGHRYCSSCFKAVCGQSEKVECPACLKEDTVDPEYSFLHLKQMFPDMAIRREMSKLRCKCPNMGCEWQGDFRAFAKHETECEFRGVNCPLCGKNIPESKLVDHKLNSCLKRNVICENCNVETPFSNIKEHIKICPKATIMCEQCRKKVKRDQIPMHADEECPKRIVPCPAGCSDLIRYDQLQTHIQKNMALHLKHTMETIVQLSHKIDERLNALTSPNVIANLEREIENLTSRIQMIESGRKGGGEAGASGSLMGGNALGDDIGASSRIAVTELRVNAFEPIMGVLHRDIERCNNHIEILERKQADESQRREIYIRKVEEIEVKMKAMERTVDSYQRLVAQNDLRFQSIEQARYDGTLIWKITDFKQKRHDALNNKATSIYSPTFYTGHVGYRMCARLYPNGDGMGKGTHISLFFVLMRGQYDALLSWPFKEKVTLMMIDQNMKEHIVDTFRPDVTSSSFRRPQSEMNIASGCPLFLPLSRLQDPQYAYVKDDTMFVQINVDKESVTKYDLNPLKMNNISSPP